MPTVSFYKILSGLLWFLACCFPLSLEAQTDTPTNSAGNQHGVIEVGSSGIRAFVIEIPADISSVSEMKPLKFFDPREVRPMEATEQEATVGHILSIMQTMEQDHQLSKNSIHLLGSSGLSESPNAAQLKLQIAERAGLPFEYITVAEESRLTLKGQMKSHKLTDLMVLDIGGGNTKASYYKTMDGKGVVDTVRLCDGVREMMKKAEPTTPFEEYLHRLNEKATTHIQPDIMKMVENNPGFTSRPKLIVSGGIFWVMASSLHPANTELEINAGEVQLDPQEMKEWIERCLANPKEAYNYRTDRLISGDPTHADVVKSRIQNNFSTSQIAAGCMILKSLSKTLDFENREQILFDRDSLYAYPQAWIFEKIVLKKQSPTP